MGQHPSTPTHPLKPKQALEREAQDLLEKLQRMIDNKHKADHDKATINQRVAEVDKRLKNMKLHGSIVPHKKVCVCVCVCV
jgi:hypothetical protein